MALVYTISARDEQLLQTDKHSEGAEIVTFLFAKCATPWRITTSGEQNTLELQNKYDVCVTVL
jgi:hypothetical protein